MRRARLVVEQFIQVVGNLKRIARQCIKSFEGQRVSALMQDRY